MNLRLVQFLCLFFGLAVGSFAWFVQQSQTLPWVRSLFACHYRPALAAYDVLKKGSPLSPNDVGWMELQEFFYKYAESQERPPIKIVESVRFVQLGGTSGPRDYASLLITFETGAPFEVPVSSFTLRSDIELQLLARPLFRCSLAFLLSGLLIDFVTGLSAIGFFRRGKGRQTSPPVGA
jgi:hypothetical protein